MKIPSDFLLRKVIEGEVQNLIYNGSQGDTKGYDVIDISNASIEKINEIHHGNLFILGETSIQRHNQTLS